MITFISGHIDITKDEFLFHYQYKLDQAILRKDFFILGNAKGVDTYALEYLIKKNYPRNKITVYYYSKYNQDLNKFLTLGINIKTGFKSNTNRDTEMTLNSDIDIAWVRSEEECKLLYKDKFRKRKSGTQLNIERRLNYVDLLNNK